LRQKQALLLAIDNQCHGITIQDFITVTDNNIKSYASINFKLDGFNRIATITGTVNNINEQREALSSFSTAINKTYVGWKILTPR